MVGTEVLLPKEGRTIRTSTHTKVSIYKDGGQRRLVPTSHHNVKPCGRDGGGNEIECHR